MGTAVNATRATWRRVGTIGLLGFATVTSIGCCNSASRARVVDAEIVGRRYSSAWVGLSMSAAFSDGGEFSAGTWTIDCDMLATGTWTDRGSGIVEVSFKVKRAVGDCAELAGRTFVATLHATDESLDVLQEHEVFDDGRPSVASRPGRGVVFSHLDRKP